MKPDDIAIDFVANLFAVQLAIREQFGGLSRQFPIAPLALTPRNGGRHVRSGQLEGVGEFRLHGIGCIVEFTTGEVIDFDWDADGCETFDRWRLSQFAQSRGLEGVSADLLFDAARRIPGVTDGAPGWLRFGTGFDGKLDSNDI
jgi:hypothetical protein